MADRRVNLNIDSNVKDIKKMLDAIQSTLNAIALIRRKSLDADKQKIQAIREQNKNYELQAKKIQDAYDKQKELLNLEKQAKKLREEGKGYRNLADSFNEKFSFSNMFSKFRKASQNKITSKYGALSNDISQKYADQSHQLDLDKAKEIAAIASSNKNSKAYKKAVSEIEDKYKDKKKLLSGQKQVDQAELKKQESAELAKSSIKSSIVTKVAQTVAVIAKTFNEMSKTMFGVSLSIKDAWGDILNYTKQMTDMYKGMATYATGSSLITNADARQTQMKYGLSSAQTYAFTQTSKLLGINGDEDLMYMNQSQKQAFTQYMQKYSSWYEQLMSSGALQDIQQMQLEFAMFKQEMAVELLQFVAQNKDTLLAAAKGVVSILEWVMKLATKILGGVFGGGSSSTSNTSNNVTVNVSYADGGAGGSQMDSFIGNLSRQISTAIGG